MVRGPCPVCHSSWVVSLVPQNCLGLRGTPSGHTRCAFLLRDALFILASASAGRLGLFHAMSFPGTLSWNEGEVSFAFVTGFVAKTRGPSLAPRFAGFTVPAQPTRDNCNGRLLYPVRVVSCYLVRFGCASSAMQVVPFCRKV